MTKLKLLRLESQLKQDQLAQNAGIARWKVSMAERGHAVLTEAEISRLSDYFGVAPKGLLNSLRHEPSKATKPRKAGVA